MASKLYQDEVVNTPEGPATFDAECYSDHRGNALFAVYGQSDKDQLRTSECRKEAGNHLREKFQKDTGREVNEISLYILDGPGSLEGSKLEYGPDREITRAVADQGLSRSIESASRTGKELDNKDWENQQDLSQHTIDPNKKPPGIGR